VNGINVKRERKPPTFGTTDSATQNVIDVEVEVLKGNLDQEQAQQIVQVLNGIERSGE
jgi:hypothetical protein